MYWEVFRYFGWRCFSPIFGICIKLKTIHSTGCHCSSCNFDCAVNWAGFRCDDLMDHLAACHLPRASLYPESIRIFTMCVAFQGARGQVRREFSSFHLAKELHCFLPATSRKAGCSRVFHFVPCISGPSMSIFHPVRLLELIQSTGRGKKHSGATQNWPLWRNIHIPWLDYLQTHSSLGSKQRWQHCRTPEAWTAAALDSWLDRMPHCGQQTTLQ